MVCFLSKLTVTNNLFDSADFEDKYIIYISFWEREMIKIKKCGSLSTVTLFLDAQRNLLVAQLDIILALLLKESENAMPSQPTDHEKLRSAVISFSVHVPRWMVYQKRITVDHRFWHSSQPQVHRMVPVIESVPTQLRIDGIVPSWLQVRIAYARTLSCLLPENPMAP